MLPILASGVWIIKWNGQIRENAKRSHEAVAQFARGLVEAEAVTMNKSLAFAEPLERDYGQHVSYERKILVENVSRHPFLAFAAVLGPDGKTVDRLEMRQESLFGDRAVVSPDLLGRASRTKRVALGPIELANGVPVQPIAYPFDDGRFLYVVYSLKNLASDLKRLKVGANGVIVLLDGSGIQVPGFGAADLKLNLGKRSKGSPALLAGTSGWLTSVPSDDGVQVAAFELAPTFPLWVLSVQKRSEAFAQPPHFVAQVATFLIALGFLIIIGAYAISAGLTRPIKQLIIASDNVARSEFDKPVPPIGWAELGQLAGAFNEMMRRLNSYKKLQVEKLLEEKAKVEALVHNIPDAIIMAGFDGSVFYLNGAARHLLGLDGASEREGGGAMKVTEALSVPEIRSMAFGLLSHKKRADAAEFAVRGKDGAPQGVFACRALTVQSAGREVGILIALRDVTAERELDKMKEEFMHAIVHDLRNPLSAVEGFIGLLARSPTLGSKEKMMMGYVKTATDTLRQLVSDILDLAKLESGTKDLKLEQTSALEILESLKALFSLQTQAASMNLVFSPGPPPLEFVGDRELLTRVMMNLIGNSLKFTPKGGTITAYIGSKGGMMEFYVQDTGRGIPADKLDFVFEKFKQLDAGKATRSGYGLGLSICKKIVELHGGRIWAESEEGKGARFIFQIPRHAAVEAAKAAA